MEFIMGGGRGEGKLRSIEIAVEEVGGRTGGTRSDDGRGC